MIFLIACALRSLPLAMAAAGVAWRLRSATQSLRIWTCLLYAALAMPLLTVALPPLRVPLLRAPIPTAVFTIPRGTVPPAFPTAAAWKSREASGVTFSVAEPAHPQSSAPTDPGAGTKAHTPIAPQQAIRIHSERAARDFPLVVASVLLPWLYLAVAAFLIFRLGVGMWIANRLQAKAAIETVAGRTVLVSDLIEVPITVGLIRPAIVLPKTWCHWAPETLNAVLNHEAAHIARGDTRTQWLARVHRAVFWFNPLSWWLVGEITELAELASDEAALEAGAEPGVYAKALLAFFSQLAGEPGRVWWRGVAMARGGSPQHRINRILAWNRGTAMKARSRTAIVVLPVAMLAAITLAAVVRPVARAGRKAPLTAAATPRPPLAQPSNVEAAQQPASRSQNQSGTESEPAPVAAAAVQETSTANPPPCAAMVTQNVANQVVTLQGAIERVLTTPISGTGSDVSYYLDSLFAPGAYLLRSDQPRLVRLPDGSFVYTGWDSAQNAYDCIAAVAGYSVQFDPKFNGSQPLTLDFRGFTVREAFDSLAQASGSIWKMLDAKTVAVKPVNQNQQVPAQRVATPTYFFTINVPPVLPLPPTAPASSDRYRDRRLLVLYLDLTTMPPADIQSGVDLAEAFVNKQMQASDLVAIAALANTLQVVADFTADKDALIRDLETLRPNGTGVGFPAAEFAVNIPDNADRSLEALTTIAQMLGPIQQKKSVLYISDGIVRTGSSNELTLRSAVNAMVSANVSIYTMDARGLSAPLPPGGNPISGRVQVPPGTALPPAPPQIQAPVPISMPEPVMPPAGVEPGHSRTVVVHIAIGTDGHVTNAKVDNPPGDDFDKNAIAAAMHWVFQPATLNGEAVAVPADVHVLFWQH